VTYSTSTFYTKYDFEFCLDVTGANSLANLVAILNGIVSSPFDVYAFDPIPITIDNTEYSAITSYDRYGIFYDQAFNLTISSTALETLIEDVAEMFAFNPTLPPVGSQEKTYVIYAKLPYVLFTDPVNATEGILTTSTKNPSDFSITTAASIVRSWDDEFVTSQIIGAGSFYGDKYTLIPLFWRTWDLFTSVDGTSIEKEDLYLGTTPFVSNTFIPSVAAGTVILPMSGTNSHTHTFIKNSGLLPGAWDSYVNLTNSSEMYVKVNNTPLIYGSSSALKLGSTSGVATTTSILSGNLTYFSVSSSALSVYTHSPTNRESLIVNLNNSSRTARFGSSSLATDYDQVLQNDGDSNLAILAKDLGVGTYKASLLVGIHEPGSVDEDYLYTTLVTDPVQNKSYIFSSALNGLEIGVTDRTADYITYITGKLDYSKTESGSLKLRLTPSADVAAESGILSFYNGQTTTTFLSVKEYLDGAVWATKLSAEDNDYLYLGSISKLLGLYVGTGVRVDSNTETLTIQAETFYVSSPNTASYELKISEGIVTAPGNFGFLYAIHKDITDYSFTATVAFDGVVTLTDADAAVSYLMFPASAITQNDVEFSFIQAQQHSGVEATYTKSTSVSLSGVNYNYRYFYIPPECAGYYELSSWVPFKRSALTYSAPVDNNYLSAITQHFSPTLDIYKLTGALSATYASYSAFNTDFQAGTRIIQKAIGKSSSGYSGTTAYVALSPEVTTHAYLPSGYYGFKLQVTPFASGSSISDLTVSFSLDSTLAQGFGVHRESFSYYTGGADLSGIIFKFIKLN